MAEHKNNTGDDADAQNKAFTVSIDEWKVIEKQHDNMLAKEDAQPPSSAWLNPVALVKKNDG